MNELLRDASGGKLVSQRALIEALNDYARGVDQHVVDPVQASFSLIAGDGICDNEIERILKLNGPDLNQFYGKGVEYRIQKTVIGVAIRHSHIAESYELYLANLASSSDLGFLKKSTDSPGGYTDFVMATIAALRRVSGVSGPILKLMPYETVSVRACEQVYDRGLRELPRQSYFLAKFVKNNVWPQLGITITK